MQLNFFLEPQNDPKSVKKIKRTGENNKTSLSLTSNDSKGLDDTKNESQEFYRFNDSNDLLTILKKHLRENNRSDHSLDLIHILGHSGQGKTTLFEYLKKDLADQSIFLFSCLLKHGFLFDSEKLSQQDFFRSFPKILFLDDAESLFYDHPYRGPLTYQLKKYLNIGGKIITSFTHRSEIKKCSEVFPFLSSGHCFRLPSLGDEIYKKILKRPSLVDRAKKAGINNYYDLNSLLLESTLQKEKILKDGPVPKNLSHGHEGIKLLLERVSVILDIKDYELFGKSRDQELVMKRYLTYFYLSQCQHYKVVEIGRLFQRDHSSIVHALKTVKKKLESESKWNLTYKNLLKNIGKF